MILVKCDRPGCDKEDSACTSTTTMLLPRGWLCLIGGLKALIACTSTCFDALWQQQMWRERRGRDRRPLEELPVTEEALLPKG